MFYYSWERNISYEICLALQFFEIKWRLSLLHLRCFFEKNSAEFHVSPSEFCQNLSSVSNSAWIRNQKSQYELSFLIKWSELIFTVILLAFFHFHSFYFESKVIENKIDTVFSWYMNWTLINVAISVVPWYETETQLSNSVNVLTKYKEQMVSTLFNVAWQITVDVSDHLFVFTTGYSTK